MKISNDAKREIRDIVKKYAMKLLRGTEIVVTAKKKKNCLEGRGVFRVGKEENRFKVVKFDISLQ